MPQDIRLTSRPTACGPRPASTLPSTRPPASAATGWGRAVPVRPCRRQCICVRVSRGLVKQQSTAALGPNTSCRSKAALFVVEAIYYTNLYDLLNNMLSLGIELYINRLVLVCTGQTRLRFDQGAERRSDVRLQLLRPRHHHSRQRRPELCRPGITGFQTQSQASHFSRLQTIGSQRLVIISQGLRCC